jgi:chromosome partitioning protein
MGTVMAVANQKGGVGKSTSVINLASACARRGINTLLIDLDPQGNATSGYGIDKKAVSPTTYDALIGRVPFSEVVHSTGRKHLSLSPANIDLAGAEIELVEKTERESVLKAVLAPIRESYDLILLDCPPSLGLLTLNALTAANGVLVPIQAEYYAMEGVGQLLETLELVHRSTNPDLLLAGVFLTMVDVRTQLARQVENEIRAYFKDRVFKTTIPRNVRLSEAPSHGVPIYEYDKWSKGSRAYEALAKEMIGRLKQEGRLNV